MKFRHAIIIVLLLTASIANAQIDTYNAGGRSAGMGNTSLTLQDTWAVFNNPAATCRLKNISTSIYYENRFLLKQTGYGALAFQMPLHKSGNIGVGLSHYGYKHFQFNRYTISYSQLLFSNFSMGINIDYLNMVQSAEYGNANGLTFELGIFAQPVKNFSIGVYAFNPVSISFFESSDLKMPTTLRLGLSYLFSDALLIAVESGKTINGYSPIFKAGIEYSMKKHFAFRAGISLMPVEYSFGVSYKVAGASFDLAGAYHQILGISPKLSVGYEF